ncbi:MAG: PAS domain S-box protein [Methylomonas sp.]
MSIISLGHDISERKRAEQQISSMNYIIDQLHDAIYVVDSQLRIRYVNQRACQILGYSRDELLSMTISDIDPTIGSEKTPKIAEKGRPGFVHVETYHRTKDGHIFPVEIGASQVNYEGQAMELSVVLDISERKRMAAKVQNHLRFFESMDRVNRAIQGSNDLEAVINNVLDEVLVIFDCDRAFLLQSCDTEADSWSVPFERTRPEYPGAHALGLVTEMDEEVATIFRLLLDSGGPVTCGAGNRHSLPKEVSEIFGFKSMMSMAIHPKADKPWQFGLHQCSSARTWTPDEERLFREIARRLDDGLSSLLAYRTLQASEREYRALAENVSLGIARYDVEGRIKYLNPLLEKLRNITTAQARGLRPTECFSGGYYDEYEAKLLQVAASGEPLEFELQHPGEDGLEFRRIAMVAERDADGCINGVLAIGQNFTAQRRAETALQRSEALYRSMVTAMIEGVIVQSNDGNIVSINPAAEKILSLSADEVQSKNLADLPLPFLIQDGKPFQRGQSGAISNLHGGQPRLEGETELCRADGENVWISVNSQPLVAEGELKPYAVVSTFHDITERKRIENTLKFIAQAGWQESGESFLVSLGGFLAQMLKVDYVLIDKLAADPAYAETVVVYGKGKILPKMQYSLSGTPCENVIEGGLLCCYPDSVQRHFPEDALLVDMCVQSYAGLPLRDSGGKTIGLIAVMDGKPMKDQNKVVSILQLVAIRAATELERNRYERALAESRQFLRRVIDTLAEPVIVKDRQHRWILVNEAFSRLIGYSQEALLGKSNYDFFPQKEADEFWLSDEAVFNTGEENVKEAGFTDRNGMTRTIITKKTRYMDDSGEMILVGIILDITERKQMEATIRKREEEFRTLAENLPDVVVRYDTSFRRTYVNKVYSRMLEPACADILGKTPLECWNIADPDAHEFTRLLQRVVETGNPELTLIKADARAGKTLYWTMKLVPEFDQDGRVNGVLSCANDITILKEYQREVEESRAQLRALATRSEKLREDERKHLARELHDDLGQRLTALKLDLARLMLRFGRSNHELQKQVEEMEADMAATIQIVRGVATQLRPSSLEMGIVSALEWLILEFRKRTNVECRLRIPKQKMALNDNQSTALFRIVQESLTNIMRYAAASVVEIVLACNGQNYILEISDDGVGFDASQKRKPDSFGLIGIEERALSLGGEMHIETAPNKGLKLTVCIPVFHTHGEEL